MPDPRVTTASLTYLGAVLTPDGYLDAGHVPDIVNTLASTGGKGLTFNPVGNGGLGSVFCFGHAYGNKVIELSLPAFVIPAGPTDFTGLHTCTVLQPMYDPTQGGWNVESIDTGGGLLVNGSSLISSYYFGYDGSGTQADSHFTRPTTTLTGTASAGIYKVGSNSPLLGGTASNTGFYDGYMGLIPSAYQSAFGGDIFVGAGNFSILSRTSNGPGVFAYTSANLGVNATNPYPLVYVPSSESSTWWTYNVPPGPTASTDGHPENRKVNAYYTQTDKYSAVVMVPGTSSVLVFGRHGAGGYDYGAGTDNLALDGTPFGSGGVIFYVYDPASPSEGNHAYPYEECIWSFDAADLQAVKEGSMDPWDVRAYEMIHPILPFRSFNENCEINGACWDTINNRLIISQRGTGYPATIPIFHAFSVDASPPPPSTESPRSLDHKRRMDA